jgi:glycosyltransferase involved in cell wall biosynthesis
MGHQINFVLLDSRQKGDFSETSHRSFFGERFFFLRRKALPNLIYYLTRAWHMFFRMVRRRLGLRALRSVDEIYFRPFTRQIESLERRLHTDIAIVEYVHFSRAFSAFGENTYKVLDTHDSATEFISSTDEAEAFRRADAVLAIQDAEADAFRAELGPDAERVSVVSHLLDLGRRIDVSATDGATFVGSSFEANLVSLRYFIDEVLPLIVLRLPWFRLSVAGSICDDIPDHRWIRKFGRVETLAEAFQASPISINPTRKGTGVKIKLLESMSLGVPVVSTEQGLEGIDPIFLGGIVRVRDDDAKGFADATIELAADPALRRRLGERGYTCAARWNERQLGALRTILTKAESHTWEARRSR